MLDFSEVWLELIRDILLNGTSASPRGQKTREILQKTITVDMRKPVLRVPDRKLSYQFMAAEAYWILTGDDRVETIAPYNKHISQFSDDGKVFFGAYGPKISGQMEYVVNKLIADGHTRQAGMTLWRENPPATKDTPCTIAIFFSIRRNKLNCHVFMRSSDAWLGVPYDVFNFSMLSHMVCWFVNTRQFSKVISPGKLYLTAASSHLYQPNIETINSWGNNWNFLPQNPTPEDLFIKSGMVSPWLYDLRDTKPGDPLRWWETEDAAE